MDNEIDKIEEAVAFFKGIKSVCEDRESIRIYANAIEALKQMARNICGQGYIGCNGGIECDSDHK